MDLETENCLASLLMDEARRLRLQADREGVHVYLCQPNVRGRPNSRFLTATVLGVQQANRTAEVNEMWRIRQKEHELEKKMAGRSSSGMAHASQMHHIDSSRASSRSRHRDRDALSPSSKHRNHVRHSSEDDGFRGEESVGRSGGGSVHRSQRHLSDPSRASSSSRHMETDRDALSASSKHDNQATHLSEDDGFNDDAIEEFLHSRVKRGRGAIGSRMDEPGPYLSSLPTEDLDMRVMEEWKQRVLGPEKPPHLRSCETFDIGDLKKKKIAKNSDDEDSSKKHRHSGKSHRAKEKDMCRKKRKEKSRHQYES